MALGGAALASADPAVSAACAHSPACGPDAPVNLASLAMKYFRIFFAAVALTLAISSVRASVYETNNTQCVIKTITIAEEYGYYDPWYGWVSWTSYWDVSLAYGETFSIDDIYGTYDETHFNVVASSESPDPNCSGGGETWESFDEPQGWSYGDWGPDPSGYPVGTWFQQQRTNTQWHYYGERSNLGNVRNDGWSQETSTEYQSVEGTQPPSPVWTAFEEVITDWHEISCNPDPSLYWEGETFSQYYDEERTVRRGERDQDGNERNVTIDTEVWSGSRPESGTRPLNDQPFEEVVTGWHEVDSSPSTDENPTGVSFTQTYWEDRDMRGGRVNDRDGEYDVTTWTEHRSNTRSATGTNLPPTAWIRGSDKLEPGVTGSWTFGVNDGNGNLKHWRFHSSTNPDPHWSDISGGSTSDSYSTAFDSPGVYTWVVDVEDNAGETDSVSIEVRVEEPDHAPTIYLDLNPNVVLTNGHVAVTAHTHDDEGNFQAMGVRWQNHDLRKWWDLDGVLEGTDTQYDRSRSYTETMAVPARTEYLRGEVWDKIPNQTTGVWQEVVVLGTWIPNVAVTPVTPHVSGNVTVTFTDAPDPATWIGIFRKSDPSNYTSIRSWTIGRTGDGTKEFSLGDPFEVGTEFQARMFPMGSHGPIAISNPFTVISDTPSYTLAVYEGTISGRTDEDGNGQDGVFHSSGWHSGDVVGISATPAPGQVFQRWAMEGGGGGAIGYAFSPTTTFTIGSSNGAVRAQYQSPPAYYLVTVSGGHAIPAGPQPAGKRLTIVADPPEGQVFSAWSSSGPGAIEDASLATTVFVVGNNAATVTASFTGNAPPDFSSQPINKNALPGATATFSVVVTGSGLSYQWFKNGVALSNGGKVSGATSASLTLTNVQLVDEASYTVVATNSFGSATSDPAQLVIFQTDTDGDGVPDVIETQLGTNPNSPGQIDSTNSMDLRINRPPL